MVGKREGKVGGAEMRSRKGGEGKVGKVKREVEVLSRKWI